MPEPIDEALVTLEKMARQYITSLRNVNFDVPPSQYHAPAKTVKEQIMLAKNVRNMIKDCNAFNIYGPGPALDAILLNIDMVIRRHVITSDIIQEFVKDLERKDPDKARALKSYDERLNSMMIEHFSHIPIKLAECLCKYGGRGR